MQVFLAARTGGGEMFGLLSVHRSLEGAKHRCADDGRQFMAPLQLLNWRVQDDPEEPWWGSYEADGYRISPVEVIE